MIIDFLPWSLKFSLQLGTGTGIAPFRSFLWKMFFEKHEDYKVREEYGTKEITTEWPMLPENPQP